MSQHEHEFYSDLSATSPGPRPVTDPVTDLLENRQVSRDFQIADDTIRVETRIKVSRSPWTIRSVVLENEAEVQEGPFAPIQEELDASQLEPETLEEARLDFARQAYEGHLARCRQVEKALGGKAPGGKSGKGIIIGVSLAILLVVGSAAGYLVWKKEKGASPQGGTATSGTQASNGGAATEPAPEAAPDSSESEKPTETTQAPVIRKGTVVPIETPSTKPVQPKSPRLKSNPRPRKSTSASETTASSPEPSPSRRSSREIISSIDPSTYRLAKLRSGGQVYSDGECAFSRVPEEYRELRLIQTVNADRDAKSSVSFVLGADAKVYVAHDQRIRKKPDWLQAFSRTGRKITVKEADGKDATYDVFVRQYSSGLVTLGGNVEWKALTKIVRESFPKKMGMYVVFVETM